MESGAEWFRVKIEIEIPDGSLAVPLVIVSYVDAANRLQSTLVYQAVGVPLLDCVALAERTIAEARLMEAQARAAANMS